MKRPAEPETVRLSFQQVLAYNWVDDLDYDGLGAAVEQSIRYYKQLPSTVEFSYDELIYSPEEMISSLVLFNELIGKYKGVDLVKQLSEKFIFFESRDAGGGAFFTGYYEPVIEGSLYPTVEFPEPVYETPNDLIEADLGLFNEKWEGEKIIGRLEGNRLVPYDSRDDIVYGKSLEGRAKPIAYVNGIDLFFLQIQGSGLVRFADGTVKRINYAQKNGHPYRSIGEVLTDKIPADEMSLQSIKEYLYSNTGEVRNILRYNQSYTFFREVDNGPLGDIEVPLTARRSVAMDKKAVPRGGLAYIETEVPVFADGKVTDWKPLRRFVIVQDTGGAIRGHGRVDIYFGSGKEAGLLAGHMKRRGRSFLIVAKKEFL